MAVNELKKKIRTAIFGALRIAYLFASPPLCVRTTPANLPMTKIFI